ncbi:hypothetical protein Vretifemale_12398 [Volvox reticuliferus]|uniref:Uncharacterized protein n=1 Tax=Volvox reticuliferus TaxID=1737510 RepID=A0A8J4CNW0_9CHLO|nr:hypothetical protein Vretifemale_12398 [Volvox reticuliferus]
MSQQQPSAATAGTPEPQTPSPAVPLRAGKYEVVDEGFVSLSQVSLHAHSLFNRRENLKRYCAERLGDELMGQVMQVSVGPGAGARAREDAPGRGAGVVLGVDAGVGVGVYTCMVGSGSWGV